MMAAEDYFKFDKNKKRLPEDPVNNTDVAHSIPDGRPKKNK